MKTHYNVNGFSSVQTLLEHVSKAQPCLHCGKPDWCYRVGELSVCKRGAEPAKGWKKTGKADKEGGFYYSLEQQTSYFVGSKKYLPYPTKQTKPKLALLSNLPNDIPQYETKYNCRTIWYEYASHLKVRRIEWLEDDTWKKEPPKPFSLVDDEWQISKGGFEWPAYRLSEAKQQGKGKWLLMVEGEKCVEFARGVGIASTTLQGGSWTETNIEALIIELKRSEVQGLVYWPDHDTEGERKRDKVQAIAERLQFPFATVQSLEVWPEMPEKGDIADWIEAFPELNLNDRVERILEVLEFPQPNIEEEEFDQEPELQITQLVVNALYSDVPWICVKGKLYHWERNYYKYSDDDNEELRITTFLNQYQVVIKGGKVSYPYAKPSESVKCLEWVKKIKVVSIDKCNPPGINCTNGILQFNWELQSNYPHPIPKPLLVPHSPDYYYLFEPLVTYDPKANSPDCDRMLSALDEPQREVFLRTIAASLDVPTVRKFKGRFVRGLLLKGNGNNGKDTLREATAILYGYSGLTGLSLNDFKAYDDGRKFALASLENSRVNWASENASTRRIDKLDALKQSITGEGIHIERKHVDAYQKVINAVFLFNVNDIPNLQGAQEAILSRYAVLLFNKTYKKGARAGQGEIEADPRFKYDRDWMISTVMPTFLNRVIKALQDLMRDWIDYSCTEQALKDIQIHNSHLYEFAQDVGLVEQPGSIVTAKELWLKLEQWYIATGTLELIDLGNGNFKRTWYEQANPRDKNVTYVNQVIPRILELFPKCKKIHISQVNCYGISGLIFETPS
ncbi:MAG: DUF5906 domain-containing protein [Microcoleaceae cyanobacterium]